MKNKNKLKKKGFDERFDQGEETIDFSSGIITHGLSKTIKLPPMDVSASLILKGDERIKTYAESFVYTGSCDFVLIPRDWQDVTQALRQAHALKTPVTFAGSRTAMTGASIPDSGMVISLEKMNRFLDMGASHGEMVAKAEPGILLGDFKNKISDENYFYPPDPTSFREAQLGGTLATNATGEDSYFFGSTRKYVQELKLILADGSEKTITRKQIPIISTKNKAGYFLEGEEIDHLIGSEGSLALIREATLKILPQDHDFFSALIPFSSFESCLDFVVQTKTHGPKLRAMEFLGPGAYEIFISQKGIPSFPKGTVCLVYLKKDFENEKNEIACTEIFTWLQNFFKTEPSFLDSVFIALSPKQKENIRQWRHFVPATVNENNRKRMEAGGGKISTDWWVPTEFIIPMMSWVYSESQKMGVDFLVFAHIGDGHPHWNYLTKNPDEKKRVENFVEVMCRRAVAYGGGVAGEHGIGKIHHNYLAIQHSAKTIQKMRELKTRWDPHWILGRNNLFSF
ncbi:MAG: hypothetical protein A3G32_07030 [Deltaproteobacteria bacterium RIFCSPLOWO2_12_FULL_40_28]|nr:MAG: hypothetical protein A3C45_07075 [Deltaproteobacteria bacterium RIFCSPHIGHO2_02_FULL_40_28]OGQ19290.1 MAG: hypothetical protein A3E27_04740 [Deltaproteobacteria bacterium RIFCSPHIGHO2_12_FULL_40_32]OGQ40486.1 MAG: hypothetical protein A3I69_00330 [Deltaproteobacteria bacterium RIFCSPLOWO2_02_FULL_40_36]OGQ53722.1 MAG: hypothetical protein A3G32_07030 [Deltaproteobacteria bacterium RIFCSPLOWO2_12_FULL_40_28]